MLFSRSVSSAQSRDHSAPVYQSSCCEAQSLESIGLVNSQKAHTLAFSLKATAYGRTLRNACDFCVAEVVYVPIPHRAVKFRYLFSNSRVALLRVGYQANVCYNFSHLPFLVLDGTN